MSTKGVQFLHFTFNLPGGARPVAPLSVTPLYICHILLSRLTKKSRHQLSHKITMAVWQVLS